MDQLPIALALLVAIATASGAALLARRRGIRLRTAVFNARALLERETARALDEGRRAEALTLAEAEAGWAARMANRRVLDLQAEVERLGLESSRLSKDASQAEQRVDELTAELRALAEDGRSREARAESAENRLAEIETELATALESLAAARADKKRADAILSDAVSAQEHRSALQRIIELEEQLLHAGEGDEESQLAVEIDRLRDLLETRNALVESLQAEAERLDREVRLVRDEADRRVEAARAELENSAPPPDILLVRQAEITELQDRLTQLTAVRNAEATRLTERIAALERLYVEVDVREARISDLEQELKSTVEALDTVNAEKAPLAARLEELSAELSAARAEAEEAARLRRELEQARRQLLAVAAEPSLDRVRAELRQVRALLAAERERNSRLVRRTAVAGTGATTRAGERVVALRLQVAELESRLESGRAMADDVTRIKGIGPKIATILAEHDITSIEQIARFTKDDIARIAPLLPVYPGRIVDDAWVRQAREMVATWDQTT